VEAPDVAVGFGERRLATTLEPIRGRRRGWIKVKNRAENGRAH
jgi:hypothetical protein